MKFFTPKARTEIWLLKPVPLPSGGGSHFLWEFLTVSGSILTLDFGFEDGVFQPKKQALNIIEAKRPLTIADK